MTPTYPTFSALPPPRQDWLSEAIERLWDSYQVRPQSFLAPGILALAGYLMAAVCFYCQCWDVLWCTFALVALCGANRRRPA